MPSNSRNGFVARTSRTAESLAAVGIVVMTLVIAWQVFGRYVLNASPVWSEAAALIIMLWFVLLGAAVGVYEQFHLGFRFLVSALPRTISTVTYIAGQALIATFGVVMAWNGYELVNFTQSHELPTLGLSRAIVYWPFVVCGALTSLFALSRIVRASRLDKGQSPWN